MKSEIYPSPHLKPTMTAEGKIVREQLPTLQSRTEYINNNKPAVDKLKPLVQKFAQAFASLGGDAEMWKHFGLDCVHMTLKSIERGAPNPDIEAFKELREEGLLLDDCTFQEFLTLKQKFGGSVTRLTKHLVKQAVDSDTDDSSIPKTNMMVEQKKKKTAK